MMIGRGQGHEARHGRTAGRLAVVDPRQFQRWWVGGLLRLPVGAGTRAGAVLAVVFLASALADWAQAATVSVAAGSKPAPKSIAPELAKALASASYAITMDGKEVAHFWLRDLVPSTAAGDSIPYESVPEGTFLGVVRIQGGQLRDFRNQQLADGVFTVRLATHPQDGNHMGIAPYPMFVCLLKPDLDKTLAALDHDELMDLAVKTLSSGHPAVLFLQPLDRKPTVEFPSIGKNEYQHQVLHLKTRAKAKDEKTAALPLGIVIVGVTDAE